MITYPATVIRDNYEPDLQLWLVFITFLHLESRLLSLIILILYEFSVSVSCFFISLKLVKYRFKVWDILLL